MWRHARPRWLVALSIYLSMWRCSSRFRCFPPRNTGRGTRRSLARRLWRCRVDTRGARQHVDPWLTKAALPNATLSCPIVVSWLTLGGRIDAMAGLPPRAASPLSNDSRPLTLFAPNDGSSYVIVSAELPRPNEMLVIGERATAVLQPSRATAVLQPCYSHQGLTHTPCLVPRAQTARAAACESRPRASLTRPSAQPHCGARAASRPSSAS